MSQPKVRITFLDPERHELNQLCDAIHRNRRHQEEEAHRELQRAQKIELVNSQWKAREAQAKALRKASEERFKRLVDVTLKRTILCAVLILIAYFARQLDMMTNTLCGLIGLSLFSFMMFNAGILYAAVKQRGGAR